jgi:NADPH:quinone reductase-like Zn-dependent oxidoreductase
VSDVVEVRAEDLRTTRLVHEPVPAPGPGQVLLRVRRFALSANNLTYGTLGERLGYWRIFPAADPGWGRLPMWGYAEVVASGHPGVAAGRELFGYVPMGTHLLVTPERVNERGLTDGSEHRRSLAAAYNAYRWLDADPLYDPAHADELALFLPVFMLPFLFDAFLAEHGDFGAHTVVVTSASSKASLGLARLLAARGVAVAGLTSPRNAAFVESLGVYARVRTYDQVRGLAREPTVLVDVAGAAAVRRAVHEHLAGALAHSATVGATHRDPGGGDPLRGPEPVWFFAPDHLRDRVREWGAAGFDERFGAALRDFAEWTRTWLTITRTQGAAAVRSAYSRVAEGGATPAEGHILAL